MQTPVLRYAARYEQPCPPGTAEVRSNLRLGGPAASHVVCVLLTALFICAS
jgi:hypothetical protein